MLIPNFFIVYATPLHYAVYFNHIDIVKLLFNEHLFDDINLTNVLYISLFRTTTYNCFKKGIS